MKRTVQQAHAPSPAGEIERLLDGLKARHPGASGVRLVQDGLDAFALRTASARSAERTLDIQCYIWRSDATGGLLAHDLLEAADRGVHVRVLLDDMDARSRDSLLLTANRHPRLEIRLFNPFATRSGVWRTILEVFARGSRLNRRMHNKAWIVDGQLAIVGGRNVGDEYFAASAEMNFVDLDILLIGPVVEEAVRNFEQYWNSEAAVPIGRLRRKGPRRYTMRNLRRRLKEAILPLRMRREYASHVHEIPPLGKLIGDGSSFDWSDDVRIVADDPRKASGEEVQLPPGVDDSMLDAFSSARRELLLISPYFVPGAGGTAILRALVRRGVAVSVLTNSLAATDVAAVHSGYVRYREKLLAGGVRLYELKPSIKPFGHLRRLHVGSSRASLHTKAALVDRERVFVGSFNLDPRSAALNCEMGVWVRSSRLAEQMLAAFKAAARPQNSFEVTLDARGSTRWREHHRGKTRWHTRDPQASWWRRLMTWLLALIPIESQL
ncbi:MAG TPA: phospholipase D family protein [Steroidobacteraceae bacterium]